MLMALIVLLLGGLPGQATLAQAHWILVWGVAVVAPLALQLTRLPHREGRTFLVYRLLQRLIPISAALMALGWLWQGSWLIAGAGTWLLTTLGFGLWGLIRLGGRPHFCAAETTLDLGLIYAPIGGIWTFAYAWQRGLMGFDPTMTLLTGDHFCYVTLGAMQWAGMAGRQLHGNKMFLALAGLFWVSPALVATGITYSHALGRPTLLESLAVSAQVLATAGISLLWLIRARPKSKPVIVSAFLSLLTMALAINYAWGRLLHLPHLNLAWMIPYHGLINALGFVTLGLLGWSVGAPTARENDRGMPFNRVGGGWPIGTDYFQRKMQLGQPPAGLLDHLDQLTSPDFDASTVAPEIHDFYQNTGQHTMEVVAEWPSGWLPLARLYGLLSRPMGQMNFPLSREEAPVISHMLGLPNMRGWVRSYASSGQAIYAAAYTLYRRGQRGLMNVAFPLPIGNLTSLLWARNQGEGLILSSFSQAGEDQGVYWVLGGLGWRLPINEEIEVFLSPGGPAGYQSPCRPSSLLARHRSWLFGIPCLTLHYAMRPLEEDSDPLPKQVV